MGVRDFLFAHLGDGDTMPVHPDSTTHVECRDCGSNLQTDDQSCPVCGGIPVVYDLDE